MDSIVVIAIALLAGSAPSARLGLPSPLVQLIIGIALRIALGAHSQNLAFASNVGLFVLLFFVGREMGASGHLPLDRQGGLIAVVGALVLFVLGTAAVVGFLPFSVAILIVIASIPTSVGVAARLFRERGALSSSAARQVISAAIADDLLSIFLVALLPVIESTLLQSGGGGSSPVVSGLVGAIVVAGVAIAAEARLSRREHRVALAILLVVGGLFLHASVVVVAVFGGYLFGREPIIDRYEWMFSRIDNIVPAVFFVVSGYEVQPMLLARGSVDVVVVVLIVALVVSRVVLTQVAVGSTRVRGAIGIGMGARGELTLAIGAELRHLSIVGSYGYAVLVGVVLISTSASALGLKWYRFPSGEA
ncbi:MAG: cation:proton antiporter [Ferrimicrobium sp.]